MKKLRFTQVYGLAMDWLTGTLYIADREKRAISVCNADKENVCADLITGLADPFSVAVHPSQGQVNFTPSLTFAK